jgi:16S rRNA C967 or C1407 C5-methylase (RsmB/RsmF family)
MMNLDLSMLPDAFVERTRQILSPSDLALWEESLIHPALTVRWTGKPERAHLGSEYLESHGFTPRAIEWCPEAWLLGSGSKLALTSLDWVAAQTLFLQSLSSMAAVMAMGVQPGHDVLDLCAAPGAKTSLIHRRQAGCGILVANELSRSRTRRMLALLKRLCISDIDILTGPGEMLGSTHARCFDRVLADVPCSGEGRFNLSDAASWSRWGASSINGLAKRQVALLEAACRTLRPGGEVVYATCTMSPEENELVVDRVLRKARTPMEVCDIELPIEAARPGLTSWNGHECAPQLQRTVRVVAGFGMTPFYMARLRRTE